MVCSFISITNLFATFLSSSNPSKVNYELLTRDSALIDDDRLRFDVVVLDPAKQTRDREEVGFALKRYLDMNRLALQAVAPGGIFLTCSCTGLVGEDEFLESVRRAAWQANRVVQVLRVSGAGAAGSAILSPRSPCSPASSTRPDDKSISSPSASMSWSGAHGPRQLSAYRSASALRPLADSALTAQRL